MSLHDDETLPPLRSVASRAERARLRRWSAIGLLVLLVTVLVLLAGCAGGPSKPAANARFLTEEQDAAMREQCAEAGCRVIPLPVWRQIEDFIRRFVPPPAQTKEG